MVDFTSHDDTSEAAPCHDPRHEGEQRPLPGGHLTLNGDDDPEVAGMRRRLTVGSSTPSNGSRSTVDSKPRSEAQPTKKKKFFAQSQTLLKVRFPLGLEVLLFLTSAAQYVGATGIGLFVVLTLSFGPVQYNDFWMYMGFVGWFSPLIGWFSDVFSIREERRRPCLGLGLCLNATFLFLISQYGRTVGWWTFIAFALGQTASEMMLFVPLNAMVVELCKNPDAIINVAVAGEQEAAADANPPPLSRRLLPTTPLSPDDGEQQGPSAASFGGRGYGAVAASVTSSDVSLEERGRGDTATATPTATAASSTEDAEDDANSVSRTTTGSSSSSNASVRTTASEEDQRRTSAAAAGQAHSMLLRSCGSLFGASLQTAALSRVEPEACIAAASVAFAVCFVFMLPFLPADLTSLADRRLRATARAATVPQRVKMVMERIRHSAKGGVKSEFSGLVAIILFIFAYTVMPSASSIYWQYVTVNFHFPAWYLSLNNTGSLVASILACHLFQRKLSRFNQTAVFVVGSACMSLGYVTNIMLSTGFSEHTLHIPNSVFVLIDTFLVSFCSRIGFMPVLQIAARHCPRGFESFMFEVFTATTLGASSLSALATSAVATRLHITTGGYGNLWLLLVVCSASKWFPVLFLAFLPKAANASAKGKKKEAHPTSSLCSISSTCSIDDDDHDAREQQNLVGGGIQEETPTTSVATPVATH